MMKVFVTGTRGIPDIPGGVEKHCQELLPRIASKGHEVAVATRSSYDEGQISLWRRTELCRCFAPRKKNLEAIVHTFLALLKAYQYRPDLVHIHGVGPSLLTPLAKVMGFRVVFTHHGQDYDRQKWGKTAKFALRLGERMGALCANEVIAISSVIGDVLLKRYHRESNLIHNGVSLPERSSESYFLKDRGVQPQEYVLAVGRFVPEKGLHDLIHAFQSLQTDHKLVIAGEADHESDYSRRLREAAANDERIVLTGYITGAPLNQVYSHAALFVLPSYHEGLPIALLEAMSYGLSVLASNIPANWEVGLSPERYFRCGDVKDLKEKMKLLLRKGLSSDERHKTSEMLERKYNWDKIADQTIEVYEKTVNGNK